MFAEVLVEYSVKSLDRTFTYIIPKHLKHLKIGMKVIVPFGAKEINGFVTNIISKTDIENLKEIIEISDEKLILNDELLSLGKFLNETTICSLISAYQAMLPSSLKVKEQKSNYQLYDEYITLNEEKNYKLFIEKNPRKRKQIEILNHLENNKKILKKELMSQALNNLIKEKYVLIISEPKVRINPVKKKKEIFDLTFEQTNAIEQIEKSFNKEITILLHGVTGSGKTEVYLKVIEKIIEDKKTALMLVPEISLTAQAVESFYDRFGSEVAVFHSGLSIGEKYDEYLKIYNNEVSVVVGTRSAIFVPLNNLGIIIIDEEHSDSYKQDNNPRYNVLEMAKFRSQYNKIPIVLGSATPTLETYSRAKKGVYKLIEMPNRIGSSTLPKVILVDMALEMQKGYNIFSELLLEKIEERLLKKEQVILLLNRRGFSTIITCQNCGHTYECPHCGITLTYHRSSNAMRCHYCGYYKYKPKQCDECHEDALKDYGLGTEKLEIELRNKFPKTNIIRMDADTTTRKGSHEKIINAFKNQEYDILLGTQMISKGLDFPKVSLVGVINADSSLNIPDFRSNENTFQLLSQVSGRAGRNKYPGEVILQTYNPDNKTLNYIKNHDYIGFYNYEMDLRKKMSYPPYYYLISIKIVGSDYELVSNESNKVAKYLKNNMDNIILGPTTSSPFKVNNQFRFQIVIKYKIDPNILNILRNLDDIYKNNNKIYLEIDTSPIRF